MSEDGGWDFAIEFAKVFIEPKQGGGRNAGILIARAFRGVEADEVPAVVREGIVELVWKHFVIGSAIGVGRVIVIAYDDVIGNAEVVQDFAHGLQMVLFAVFS